jgi:diguanylate cyclase
MNTKITSDLNTSDNSLITDKNSLRAVLDQSKEIKNNVQNAADQISSVNTILEQEEKAIPSLTAIEEVIDQNKDAEQKVTKAVDDLRQVNAELAKQVTEKTKIELELRQTKSELSDMRANLSESKVKEQDALHIAMHDSLTGLPNRLFLEQRLNHGLTQSRRYGWKLAILLIDLDKFKQINDSFGHDIGDKLLITVANRLQAYIRGEDMVSRWGGDEFICILLNVNHDSDVISVANKIVDQISRECDFDGTIISINATIGITICPRDGDTADILLKKADSAMYRSKGEYQRVRLFDESILEVE